MAETLTSNYSWTKPDPGASPNTWGNTLNGDLDKIDAQVWLLNTQATLNAMTVMRGPDGGAYGAVAFNSNAASISASLPRWAFYETSETESGGNAGTNFGLNAYADSGATLGQAFTIVRATLASTFNGAMTINGVLTTGGAANIGGTLGVSNALNVTNAATVGSLSVTNNATVGGTLNAGATTVGGTFTVNGVASFNTDANYYGFLNGTNANFTGTFSINSAAITNGEIHALKVDTLAYFAAATSGTNFAIGEGGGVRFIQYSPQWAWNWNETSGLLSWNTPTGAVFQLDGSGNLYLNGGLTQHSDVAAKENIAVFDGDPLAVIRRILPKNFNWIASPERRELGFVAQDVRAALPEAVHESKDGKLGINDTPLLAILWRAVQTLADQVKTLEAQLAER